MSLVSLTSLACRTTMAAPAGEGREDAGLRYLVPHPRACHTGAEQQPPARPQHSMRLGRVPGPPLRREVVEAAAIDDKRE
jgi:hypothetical protein